MCLSCTRNTLPGHNVVRRQNFDIRTRSLIHVPLRRRKPHFTDQEPLCSKDWEKAAWRVIFLSITLLTPRYLRVTSGGRNLSWAVFHKIHLSSSHHMGSFWSLLQCLQQLKIISHHRQAHKTCHFISTNVIITRKSLKWRKNLIKTENNTNRHDTLKEVEWNVDILIHSEIYDILWYNTVYT